MTSGRGVALMAALFVLSAPALSAADAPPSFEGDLQAARASVLESLKARQRARSLADAARLQRLAWDARRLEGEASRLRWRVSDARRRAQQIASRPGSPRDAFFESELRRLVWELRTLENDSRSLESIAAREAARASADPSLVSAAERFHYDARLLLSAAGWLNDETRWARMDIQRAGYQFEAWDVERHGDAIRRACEDAERSAQHLLQKIRG